MPTTMIPRFTDRDPEGDAADARYEKMRDDIQPVILRTLKDYRVSGFDPEGSAELVDFLSPEGGTIEPGLRELDEIADEIAIAVAQHLSC